MELTPERDPGEAQTQNKGCFSLKQNTGETQSWARLFPVYSENLLRGSKTK